MISHHDIAVVVKAGGSLLDLPGLAARLAVALEVVRREAGPPVLVVGGGRFVDELRRLDRVHGLGEAACHDLAVAAMGWTARLLAALLGPGAVVVADEAAIEEARSVGRLPILDPGPWLARDEAASPADALPHTWATTSDSLAARLAGRLGADLVLLKSAPFEAAADAAGAAALGLVDPVFPAACAGLRRVGVIDLRGAPDRLRWLACADARQIVSSIRTGLRSDRVMTP